MAAPRPEEMTREEQWAHIASEMEALTLESKRIVEQRRAGIAAFAARSEKPAREKAGAMQSAP